MLSSPLRSLVLILPVILALAGCNRCGSTYSVSWELIAARSSIRDSDSCISMRGSDLIVFGTLFPVPPDMKCYRVSWQTTNGSGTVDIQFDNGPVQTVKIVDNRIERQP